METINITGKMYHITVNGRRLGGFYFNKIEAKEVQKSMINQFGKKIVKLETQQIKGG